MKWARYLVEWGCGATFTTEDPHVAAERAVRDAMSRVCPLDFEVLGGLEPSRDLKVEIVVGVPEPWRVRPRELEELVPYDCEKAVRVVEGGLKVPGVRKPEGGFASIVIAVAAVTIYVRSGRRSSTI